jgi:EAL domain-containing protein (putative c-di-GMP-specific phosphodiesterase class I)
MISLDDFGTGFSSLSHLQKFPVNMIKIDRTFVRQMLVDYDCMQIVKASIGLAHALDLEAVAEGVENEDELARLAELKCDYAQGYCYTKPLPLDEAIEYLKQQ